MRSDTVVFTNVSQSVARTLCIATSNWVSEGAFCLLDTDSTGIAHFHAQVMCQIEDGSYR